MGEALPPMDLARYGTAARLMATNASSILTAVFRSQRATSVEAAVETAMQVTARHRSAPILIDMPLRRGFVLTNVGRIDEGLTPFGDDLEAVRIIGPNVKRFPVPVVVAYGHRGALHLHLFACPGLSSGALEEIEGEVFAALDLPSAASPA